MSQETVELFLKERKNSFFSSREIAKFLNLSDGSVNISLRKLLYWGDISLKKVTNTKILYGYDGNGKRKNP